ncbi:hypothetical protein LV475_08635 [Guyparkeria hydrothermalis]|uniref:hypothetical protein n=1 Tax=Guyparkeria TaxID=2035712 RepID=UPI0010ABF54C|nr:MULTISPECIES: hypothetical protein [Guyparkeria]MCL7751658.1 hypothetical protein [Guyparkeria hydrothermalis]TKA91754.1 hypothetical protein FAZ79_00145 [Guyparkeria sp. SB14A]
MSTSDLHEDDREHVSEEDLNAFVDNQLDAESRRRVRRAIRRHPELAQEVCDLDQMKDWVQQAYAAPPMVPDRYAGRSRPGGWRRAVAASLLVGAGVMIGWLASSGLPTPSTGPGTVAEATAALNEETAKQDTRIILHVGSSDRQTFDQALDTAESLLANADNNPNFHLQVLANSGGVNLVRQNVTPHAQRIAAMLRDHPNLEFTACGQSLARLQREGEDVAVLPNVEVVDTAVSEVVRRMQRGWTYIRI